MEVFLLLTDVMETNYRQNGKRIALYTDIGFSVGSIVSYIKVKFQ